VVLAGGSLFFFFFFFFFCTGFLFRPTFGSVLPLALHCLSPRSVSIIANAGSILFISIDGWGRFVAVGFFSSGTISGDSEDGEDFCFFCGARLFRSCLM
jgi:hypothetical protein